MNDQLETSSKLRCFAFPEHPRGIVVERFQRVLLDRGRERRQLLLGYQPVLHVAPLRATGFLPQLSGPLRATLLQLLVGHVVISPPDSLGLGLMSPHGDTGLSSRSSRRVGRAAAQSALVS